MLRVNVGLSRKLSRDYNSAGYTINLEGELLASLDDPEGVIERIREFYDLADEALRDQIERDASITALAAHDATPPAPQPASRRAPVNRISETAPAAAAPLSALPQASAGAIEPATAKQKQFLQTLAKRLGLDDHQLETRIAEVLGRPVRLGDLTKREAGEVLDHLTAVSPTITHP